MADLAPIAGELWRFQAMSRHPGNIPQGDLTDARSRSLSFNLRSPNSAQFTIDGRSSHLGWLEELRSDLVAYRYSDRARAFVPMFRGAITQSQDQASPTVHTVTMTATDYRGILARRSLRSAVNFSQVDQGPLVGELVSLGNQPPGTASSLGLSFQVLDPAGISVPGGVTGIVRDRSYGAGAVIMDQIDNIATDINGFEWSFEPALDHAGSICLWYPQRGTDRPYVAQYGSTVSNFSRSITTTNYASYAMVTGASSDPTDDNAPPLFAESFGPGWLDPLNNPEGAWMSVSAQSDVSMQATLQQSADGVIALYGDLEPSYSLTLVPGRWSPDDLWLGDTCSVLINSGRLQVNTAARVTAIGISIDESGVETTSLTCGLAPASLGQLLAGVDRRLDKLEIR